MFFSLFITVVSGAALLLLVMIVSLLFLGGKERIAGRGGIFSPLGRFVAGRCSGKDCPSFCLCSSCLCLLLVFLFIPMGSLPQFVSTRCDIFVILVLLALAQSLYIRGMKFFSADFYQSLERSEINSLFKFTMCAILLGGTLSWYALNRGVPGDIFSLNTFSAMPLWRVTGFWGKTGLVLFLILLALTMPGKRIHGEMAVRYGDIPIAEMFDAVRLVTCPALMVPIFFPLKIGLSFGIIGFPMYALDFALFWLAVFFMETFALPGIRMFYAAFIKPVLSWRSDLLIHASLGAAGTMFMMFDIYL